MMSAHRGERRDKAIQAADCRIKSVVADGSITRDGLECISSQIENLASERWIWEEEAFCGPEGQRRVASHRLTVEGRHCFALYLKIFRHRTWTRPHNHLTWCCIAPISGQVWNYLYNRHDFENRRDEIRSQPTLLRWGASCSLMPEDVHSLETDSDGFVKILHAYGGFLESIPGRSEFVVETKTWRAIPL